MSDVIKFTDEEMVSIAKLQNDYQQSIYMLGQIDLEKTDLEQQLKDLNTRRNEIFENPPLPFLSKNHKMYRKPEKNTRYFYSW